MAIAGNEDHKQRVNLSGLARTVIELDQSTFGDSGNLSGFLNRIITAFRDQADASIDLAVTERQQQLLEDGYALDVANRLTEEYRRQLMLKKEAYPQGDSLMFRLNNYNFDLLYTQRLESNAYSAPSKYLKALLEEYARLSPSERERVYYGELISGVLEPALDAGYLLDVQVSGKRYLIKPHNLMADPYNSHLYLTGYARRADKTAEEETIASFRVSRLVGAKTKKQPKGRLSPEQKREIEKQLQQVGVQYLVGSRDQIKVRLTPAGQQAFLQRSYMRPLPERIEGDVYCFCCAPMQIRNYFFSFGKEAQVLEPAPLRKEFLKIYREAARAYE